MRERIAVLAALVAVVVVAAPTAGAQSGWSASGQASVLPAEDTVDTAIALSRLYAPSGSVDEVLLGRADLFADTLAAGSATGRPVLLTDRNELDPRTAEELERLGASRVVILGGTEAISSGVEQDLDEAGYDVARLGGDTRVETALLVAAHYHPSVTAQVVLARAAGEGTAAFADTLGGSALAHTLDGPVLITPSHELDTRVADYLRRSSAREVVIAGGPHAISSEVEAELRSLGLEVRRTQGAARADTALAQNAFRGLRAARDADAVLLIDGWDADAWAAGFAGAAWAAASGAPIVLSDRDLLSDGSIGFLVDAPDTSLVCAPPGAACDRADRTMRIPPFAATGEVTLRQPSASVEMVGFHESNHDGAQQLEPLDGGAPQLTMETRHRGTGSRTSADVVAEPGVAVRAPVSGTVIRAGSYVLYCDHTDHYAVIEPDAHPGWEVKMLHMVGLRVQRGDRVTAARTVIADGPRQLPFGSQVDDHSGPEDWPHVHLEVVDPSIPDRPGSGC